MQDKLLDMLLQKDEITWQSLIYDLVKTEQMNPWDIDISLLAQKYLQTLKQLKEANFFISGKVILASAILLKLKTAKLVSEDIANFDSILFKQDELFEELEDVEQVDYRNYEKPLLTIKTPQPRKRKVSINDLIDALQKALEVDNRRTLRRIAYEPAKMQIPEKKIDISALIKDVYKKVVDFLTTKKETLTFSKLTENSSREEKILTFIPLLHLDNQEKVYLDQEESFGEIKITVAKPL